MSFKRSLSSSHHSSSFFSVKKLKKKNLFNESNNDIYNFLFFLFSVISSLLHRERTCTGSTPQLISPLKPPKNEKINEMWMSMQRGGDVEIYRYNAFWYFLPGILHGGPIFSDSEIKTTDDNYTTMMAYIIYSPQHFLGHVWQCSWLYAFSSLDGFQHFKWEGRACVSIKIIEKMMKTCKAEMG